MKRIVIMGASSGIGLRTAEIFALTGWHVGVAARNEGPLRALKEMFPTQVEYEVIDVTRSDAPHKLTELIRRLGGMDVYFHVAGIFSENPSLDLDKEVAVTETNTTGFVRMVDTAYHYFCLTRIKGTIAAVTSVAGVKGIGRMAAYSASKRFQWNYLEALEQLSNNKRAGISFIDIRPGWVRTPLLDKERKYPVSMSLDHVAPLVVDAIERKIRIAVVDWRWAIGVFFWRLIPGCLWVKMPVKVSRAVKRIPRPAK